MLIRENVKETINKYNRITRFSGNKQYRCSYTRYGAYIAPVVAFCIGYDGMDKYDVIKNLFVSIYVIATRVTWDEIHSIHNYKINNW